MNTCECTKEIKPWTTEQKNDLRRITVLGLKHFPALVRCFHETSATVALKASERGYDWMLLYNLELSLIEMYRQGIRREMAITFFTNWAKLMQEFWPDCDWPCYKTFLTEYSELQKAGWPLELDCCSEP